MRLIEVVVPSEADHGPDNEHAEALVQTGFWGRQGAGCLFLARAGGRFLVAHRSGYVEQPGTWGTWGGAIDAGENPAVAVRREAVEEAGAAELLRVVPLLVFASGQFRYHNFLAVVADEFTPGLNWENQGYRWCRWGNWPSPLHFGLRALLADPASVATMQRLSGPEPGTMLGESAGYLYHATNRDNALAILAAGKIATFRPGYGTDQDAWPDGRRERRAYFTPSQTSAKAFHPPHGRPVLLRLPKSAAAFCRERGTGDLFCRHPVRAGVVEYRDDAGNWHPLAELPYAP